MKISVLFKKQTSLLITLPERFGFSKHKDPEIKKRLRLKGQVVLTFSLSETSQSSVLLDILCAHSCNSFIFLSL